MQKITLYMAATVFTVLAAVQATLYVFQTHTSTSLYVLASAIFFTLLAVWTIFASLPDSIVRSLGNEAKGQLQAQNAEPSVETATLASKLEVANSVIPEDTGAHSTGAHSTGAHSTGPRSMEQRFSVLDEGAKPRIYKVPIYQTARLINEFPFRKVEIFETLSDAKEAALAIISHAEASAKSGIAMSSKPATPQNEEMRKALSGLTEDRVERYYFC